MPDITELAQSEINDALAQLKQLSEYPTPSTQYARVLRKYITSQAEALEEALRHANLTEAERQAYLGLITKRDECIEQLEKRNTELEKGVVELDAARQRIAELESKLSNPVQLPHTNGYWTETEKAYEEAITLAKRQIRLAVFRCERDE